MSREPNCPEATPTVLIAIIALKTPDQCYQSAMKSRVFLFPVKTVLAFAAASFLLPSAFVVRAADLYWDGDDTTADADGGSGTWDTSSTNWDDAETGGFDATWDNSNPDTAFFGGAAGTVTLNTVITANGLVFNTAGYLITGNTLTLGGATPTVTTNADATIASILAGSANLTKAGSGKVRGMRYEVCKARDSRS